MRINIEALAKVGVTVRVYDRPRNTKSRTDETPVELVNGFIEIAVEGGIPLPDVVQESIRELVHSPEFADATIGELYTRIHTLQVLEAINKTENK